MKYSQISAVNTDTLTRGMNQSLSYSSSCISEAFFDAREYASDGGQYSSDDSGSGSDDDGDLTSDDETVSVDSPSLCDRTDGRTGSGDFPAQRHEFAIRSYRLIEIANESRCFHSPPSLPTIPSPD